MPSNAATLGPEMYRCPDCRLCGDWTPEGTEYWTLLNGNSMTFSGMTFPMSSEIVPCPKHLKILRGES